MFAWGDNDHGQQGNGTTTVNRRPQMVLGLEEFKITRVACGSSHSMAWAESDFPAPITHEPVMFPASRDPLGASCLGSDSQEQGVLAESECNEYGEHRHRPSLAKIVLSLNSNFERQQALSHILAALQIIYSRDAVVRALMHSHSFVRGESKPETEDDKVVALASVSEVSIDDGTLTEVASDSRKLTLEGIDEFTSSLGQGDARLLVELLKLAVADRAGDNGREVLSDVVKALAQAKQEVSNLFFHLISRFRGTKRAKEVCFRGRCVPFHDQCFRESGPRPKALFSCTLLPAVHVCAKLIIRRVWRRTNSQPKYIYAYISLGESNPPSPQRSLAKH